MPVTADIPARRCAEHIQDLILWSQATSSKASVSAGAALPMPTLEELLDTLVFKEGAQGLYL
jgi:hypothetical protein